MHVAITKPVTDEIDRRINQKFPKFQTMSSEVQARFAKYYNPKHKAHLADMCFYDESALDLALKYYPELDAVDWPKATKEWVTKNWMGIIPALVTRTLWYPELIFDFGMPYREVVKLPRREFARKVLEVDDVLLKVHFDLELMKVWAGLSRPEVIGSGGVSYINFNKGAKLPRDLAETDGPRMYIDREFQEQKAKPSSASSIGTDTQTQTQTSFAPLITAAAEERQPLQLATVSSGDIVKILHRLDGLETGLRDVLQRLAKLETAPPELIKSTENIALTVTSLSQVFDWMLTQERVPVADLRERLLPLDQLPSAFVDEINEKALEWFGDIALEEVGDEVLVAQDVFLDVVCNWEDSE
jgi:hypothetical protein